MSGSAHDNKPASNTLPPNIELRPIESLTSPIAQRRVRALLDVYPSLPVAIALAMVQCTTAEPMGLVLDRLEGALDGLDALPDFERLSGGQLRVLNVALVSIAARIADLQAKLNLVWENS